MRVSVFNISGRDKTLSYAYVNGAEAVSRYWGMALLKAWYRSKFIDRRVESLQIFLSKMLIHHN